MFVAAHTSAGKTVVAEYAFALAAKVSSFISSQVFIECFTFLYLYLFWHAESGHVREFGHLSEFDFSV